jgi:hypothetical protein
LHAQSGRNKGTKIETEKKPDTKPDIPIFSVVKLT